MAVCLAASLLAAGEPSAQTVEVTGYGVAATNSEIDPLRHRQAKGLGIGADVRLEFGQFRIEARGITTSLRADFSIQPDYALHELEALGTYFWRPYLALQVGAGRRFVDPDFTAQEVSSLRLGLLSETRLTRLASIWVVGSLVPASRFSGGGTSVGVALGLGTRIGTARGRFHGVAEFEFQRLDRKVDLEVGRRDAPIRSSVARVGFGGRL